MLLMHRCTGQQEASREPQLTHAAMLVQKPFSFIGFGGGRHGCMGTNFAYLQIKTILSVILRNFEVELVDSFPEPDYTSMVVAPKPCRIHFRRRSAPLST